MLIYPYAGIVRQLSALLQQIIEEEWKIRLYQNEVASSLSVDTPDFVEADYGGYGPFLLDTWTSPIIDPPPRAIAKTPPFEFIDDGSGPANTIWGAYLTDKTDALVCFQPLPDGPTEMNTGGAFVTLSVVLSQQMPEIV